MKTRMNQITIVLFVAASLMCGNISAEGKEVKNALSLENVADPTLKIEDWMVNGLLWNLADKAYLNNEPEVKLALEPWMTDAGAWEQKKLAVVEVEDDKLELEQWMADESFWLPVKTNCRRASKG